MALDGKICLSVRPRGYGNEIESKWQNHEETLRLNEMLASVEAIAKEHKIHLTSRQRDSNKMEADDSFDEEIESDDDGGDGDLASDNYRNYYRGFESTDEKDHTETNDTDADMGNKFKVLTASDDF